MPYKKIKVPKKGAKISIENGKINVPDNPIIPFIEGDGIGVDITPPMINVVNEAVKIAYKGKKKIEWMEVYCGEKATKVYTKDTWLPDETIDALKEFVVSIKGPLTTPVGGGIRSLKHSWSLERVPPGPSNGSLRASNAIERDRARGTHPRPSGRRRSIEIEPREEAGGDLGI